MLLEVRDRHVELHTREGVAKAVNGVSYSVDAGETLAVLGESGSGKSVTAQAIMGILDVPPGRMAQQLASGTIDAISTWEPVRSDAHAALGDNARSFTGADAYAASQVVVGRNEFLKTRPGAIQRLMRALLKAEAFNRAAPQQAFALVADQLKLDTRTLAASGWKDFQLKVDLRQSQLVTLEDEARWAMARGYADKGPVPNFLPHLHLDALLAVQPERVTVVH